MNTKIILNGILLAGLALGVITTPFQRVAYAQEQVANSKLAGVPLPAGALQVEPEILPSQITEALGLMVQAAGPQVKRGETEVLAWAGEGYKLSYVPQMKAALSAKLKAVGWIYKEGEPLPGAEAFTMISIVKTAPERKAVIGFWAPTESALMLAWTEMLPGNTGIVPPDVPGATKPTTTEEATEIPADGPATPSPGEVAANPAQVFEVPTNRAVINVMKGVSPPRVTFAPLQPKPGFVRGFVKDAKGRPLQGAVIGVRSSATGGAYSGAQGKTDAKGYYEITVPWGAAEFYCAGYTVDYYDERAAIGLYPADGEADSFASANGAVENWVMVPYGIANRDRASEDPGNINNYFGGALTIGYFVADPRFEGDNGLPEGAEIDLTLVPDGPLLDGSKGRNFVFHQRVEDGVGRGFKIVNVPVGRYRVVAWLKQAGKAIPLRLKETGPKGSAPFGMEPKQAQQSATITFRPEGATAGKVAAGYGNWDTLDITLSR